MDILFWGTTAGVAVLAGLIGAMIGHAKGEQDRNWHRNWLYEYLKSEIKDRKAAEAEAKEHQESADYYRKAIDLLAVAHVQEIAREVLKAKREHGKKVRKQADRVLERSEREYEARMNHQQVTLNQWKHDAQRSAENLVVARMELSGYQALLSDVLENQVKLPGVRNKLFSEINKRHKSLKERLA